MSSPDQDDAPKHGQISSEDRDEIRGRASDLDRRLKQARGVSGDTPTSEAGAGTGRRGDGSASKDSMGHALRTSAEMVTGILVGVGIGWLLDQWLGTWPAFFIVFFLLGAAAGMTNVVRAGMSMKTGPLDPSKGPSVRYDDDDN